ncbi:MAG TPA: hypothetical protein PLL30_16425 [Candidatus Krumholzibacteria bacterium]|nr:hypothetical protein [Candidatus Krumholzibacteria bacterium]HPD73358.1 hypothetical protein [Candidatus Krumholzibacteria bacterium]HRY42121.1 hypothetical protein [Candidatus Krumholzibacteria bacterium]
MSTRLDPRGNAVSIDGLVLRTPGLDGDVTVSRPTRRTLRAEAKLTAEFDQALRNEGVQSQWLVEIGNASERPRAAAPTRSTSFGEDAWELTVPAPNDAWEQFVLYRDEAGVVSWEFARDDGGQVDTRRGGASRTYVLPRRVVQADPGTGTRGAFTAIGSKLLSVVAFKLIDPAIGAVGEFFAEKWEQKKRPYRLRTFTPDDYDQPDGAAIDDAMWRRLAGGRALLLVHGTFSRAHTGFGGMPRSFVEQLHAIYEGRVFAFDHFTLSHTPRENIDWLLERLPADRDLDLDILCHSRGGLVSRTLAEKQGELAASRRAVKVGRVVFVAAPNGGTALADSKHMGSFIDSYTNLVNFVPDNGFTAVLEGVITVAKILATGTVRGLPGLRAMDPRGEFLPWLNAPATTPAVYHALASDFEPAQSGWKEWAKNRLMDSIFKSANDLVVPTVGVYDANGSDHFPIRDRLEFARSDGISHTAFFGDRRAQEAILGWLG